MSILKIIIPQFVLSLALIPAVRAELILPAIFSDHMVLQQQKANPIWGWDAPGTTITVTFAGRNYTSTTDGDGRWSLKLAPLSANAMPQTLTVTGSTQRDVQDVLVGEVWLCSGQSNMEMGIGLVQDAPKEIAAANHPEIRLLKVPRRWQPEPQTNQTGNWKICSPENIVQGGWNGFSAVGYFFGRNIQGKLYVPVGLIDATWGGTRIESWTAPEGFASVPSLTGLKSALGDPHNILYQQALGHFLGETEQWLVLARSALSNAMVAPAMPVYPPELLPPHDLQDPAALFNGMIAPVHPFGIRGSIWYQGEANNGEGRSYAEKMKALVGGWRQIWGEGAFPFYFVQLAPYNYERKPEDLSELWEAQSAAVCEIPNVGMAVINDIGNLKDIHPTNKQEVGRRLALLALAKTYGHKELICSGPTFHSMSIEGDQLRIRFDYADGGLVSRDGQPLNWFEMIDADVGDFVKAQVRIDGSSVVLSSPEVHHPVAMRFAWSQLAEPNLMNGAGLPAGAFRAGTVPTYTGETTALTACNDAVITCNNADKTTTIAQPAKDWKMAVGHAYLNPDALQSYVVAFQLPTLGAGKHFGRAKATFMNDFAQGEICLQGLNRVSAASTIAVTDYFLGAAESPDATRLQEDFTKGRSDSSLRKLASGDIGAWLNAQYADGKNAGKFIFLRLSANTQAVQNDFYTLSQTSPDQKPAINYYTTETGQ